MKIAFVNQPGTSAAPIHGGDSIGIWSYQVARRLVPVHQVLFYGRRSGDRPSYYKDDIDYRGILVKLDKFFTPLRLLDRLGIFNPKRPFFASQLYYLTYALQIALDLKKEGCDIIHIHNLSQFVPIIRAFNPKAKIVLHMHCEWLNQLDLKTIASRVSKTDLVIGCSEYISDRTRQSLPQFTQRCQTVFNGVDVACFTPQTENFDRDSTQFTLLYVGRISPEKGVHLLIDAFLQVAEKYPQARLEIVGAEAIVGKDLLINLCDDPKVQALKSFYPGSYLEQLKQRIPDRLRHRIVFVGPRSQVELRQHYWNADILVNPSLSESFGMSLAEAMACEVPVIGARVGGMTSVIDEGKTGLLFESANVSELTQAILKLLGDENLRKQMGKAGRERVLQLFTWEAIAEDLIDRYKNLD